ncbi:MAG: ankyrin repeat domain-containing protein [Verrucomicrobiota bacterium]|jgi:ankyrin repeat protein
MRAELISLGLVCIIGTILSAGCSDASNPQAFLTALKKTHAYYEATAGAEHPGLQRAMQTSGGNANATMAWLGSLMQRDYKTQIEGSISSLADASRNFREFSMRAGLHSELTADFQRYSEIIQRNRAFFTSANTLDLLQQWANDYAEEDSLFEKLADGVSRLAPGVNAGAAGEEREASAARDKILHFMNEALGEIPIGPLQLTADEQTRLEMLAAAWRGDLAKARVLVARDPNLVSCKDDTHGNTPLHWAAREGRKDVVEFLLASKADVNSKSSLVGYTPLMEAAAYDRKDVVESLLKNGAEVNAKAPNGETALGRAACFSHNKDVAELLLAKGADVNAEDTSGWTPLHGTAWKNNQEIAALLIANRANVNAKDEKGETPLQLAISSGSHEVEQLLLKNGGHE